MTSIQEQALKRAVSFLDALKFSYAIVDDTGKKHGTLELKGPVKRATNREFPHGERSKYARDFLTHMQIGDVVVVPCAKYGHAKTQSSLISIAHQWWGSGSVTTTTNAELQEVQIMRIT
jgi:hypothetical protein